MNTLEHSSVHLSTTHSGLSATLVTSTSASLASFLYIFFFKFPFQPNESKQMSALWSLDLLQVSSHRVVCPGRSCAMPALGVQLVLLWLGFSAVQIKVI